MRVTSIFCLVAKPSAPNGVQITEVSKSHVELTWRIPNSDGGSPIIGYVIETRAPGRTSKWQRANRDTVPETTYKITGLREGRFYDIRVSAENAAGIGPTAEISGERGERATPGETSKPRNRNLILNLIFLF